MEEKSLREELRGLGLRATPSRVAVLRLLRAAARPLSHAEVVESLSESGYNQSTLYRNLNDLVSHGLARRTEIGDRVWRFELIDGAHPSREHPHFVCTLCGTVQCLLDAQLTLQGAVATGPRALQSQHLELQVRGLCDNCEESKRN